jgi:hypothetical protein
MECKKHFFNFGLFAECNGHGIAKCHDHCMTIALGKEPGKILVWALCRVSYMVAVGKDFFEKKFLCRVP